VIYLAQTWGRMNDDAMCGQKVYLYET